MQTRKAKPKPIKLEWTGNILTTENDGLVVIKTSNTAEPKKIKKPAEKIAGTVFVKTESKGRAGKPVAILFQFSDPLAKEEENLKLLCSDLKNKLACGGTVEENEIVLMSRDINKLIQILQESFGIHARRK